MRRILIAAIVAASAAAPAVAQNWTTVEQTRSPDSSYWIDPHSIRRVGGEARVVVRRQTPRLQAEGAAYAIDRVLIDCRARRFRLLNVVKLGADGREMERHNLEAGGMDLEPVQDGSAMAGIAALACPS